MEGELTNCEIAKSIYIFIGFLAGFFFCIFTLDWFYKRALKPGVDYMQMQYNKRLKELEERIKELENQIGK